MGASNLFYEPQIGGVVHVPKFVDRVFADLDGQLVLPRPHWIKRLGRLPNPGRKILHDAESIFREYRFGMKLNPFYRQRFVP